MSLIRNALLSNSYLVCYNTLVALIYFCRVIVVLNSKDTLPTEEDLTSMQYDI